MRCCVHRSVRATVPALVGIGRCQHKGECVGSAAGRRSRRIGRPVARFTWKWEGRGDCGAGASEWGFKRDAWGDVGRGAETFLDGGAATVQSGLDSKRYDTGE